MVIQGLFHARAIAHAGRRCARGARQPSRPACRHARPTRGERGRPLALAETIRSLALRRDSALGGLEPSELQPSLRRPLNSTASGADRLAGREGRQGGKIDGLHGCLLRSVEGCCELSADCAVLSTCRRKSYRADTTDVPTRAVAIRQCVSDSMTAGVANSRPTSGRGPSGSCAGRSRSSLPVGPGLVGRTGRPAHGPASNRDSKRIS